VFRCFWTTCVAATQSTIRNNVPTGLLAKNKSSRMLVRGADRCLSIAAASDSRPRAIQRTRNGRTRKCASAVLDVVPIYITFYLVRARRRVRIAVVIKKKNASRRREKLHGRSTAARFRGRFASSRNGASERRDSNFLSSPSPLLPLPACLPRFSATSSSSPTA